MLQFFVLHFFVLHFFVFCHFRFAPFVWHFRFARFAFVLPSWLVADWLALPFPLVRFKYFRFVTSVLSLPFATSILLDLLLFWRAGWLLTGFPFVGCWLSLDFFLLDLFWVVLVVVLTHFRKSTFRFAPSVLLDSLLFWRAGWLLIAVNS